MRRVLAPALVLTLLHCSSAEDHAAPGANSGDAGGTQNGSGGSAGSAKDGSSGTQPIGKGYPDALDPNDSPPKIGEPGCGFATAAFCDTFGAPSVMRGRGGELDAVFWSASRMMGQLSTTRPIGIGMAVIPECRPGVSNHVWPPDDTLICHPTVDLASGHLLVAAAAQNYGQNGYRIRQPFDFAGRTGKIVFDASMDPLSPLWGWVSLAITEDPISMPGYSLQNNDEGSIIPKNAVEVHFVNSGGTDLMTVRNIHVFENYVDTVYEPPSSATPVSHATGKVNHFEVSVSEAQVEVRMTPYSEDGVTFGDATFVYTQPVSIPFTRGYVHLSLHNHATIKYSEPGSTSLTAVVDASVARIDNVGFDGPVVSNWREYEVPDALVQFNEANFQPFVDPYNPQNAGVDIGYWVGDQADGPRQRLTFKGVDPANVTKARVGVSMWVNFLSQTGSPADYTLRARLNGNGWRDRKLTAEEAAFFGDQPGQGPTALDPSGNPVGDPGTQGRLGLLIDVPVEDLVAGDNTIEFVTANVPTDYPPIVCNIDLVLGTN
jgi:hypothetical protein